MHVILDKQVAVFIYNKLYKNMKINQIAMPTTNTSTCHLQIYSQDHTYILYRGSINYMYIYYFNCHFY